jgi:DNA-binding MarR family transcriptional regulator
MAHSIQTRTRAIELLNEGYTQKKVSELLKVGTTSIKRWKKEIEEHGAIRYFYCTDNRVAPKLPCDKLLAYYEENDDELLKETAAHFNCTPSAVHRACKRYKKKKKKKNRDTKNKR